MYSFDCYIGDADLKSVVGVAGPSSGASAGMIWYYN